MPQSISVGKKQILCASCIFVAGHPTKLPIALSFMKGLGGFMKEEQISSTFSNLARWKMKKTMCTT